MSGSARMSSGSLFHADVQLVPSRGST